MVGPISTVEFASDQRCRNEAEQDWATAELVASPSQQGKNTSRLPKCAVPSSKSLLNQDLGSGLAGLPTAEFEALERGRQRIGRGIWRPASAFAGLESAITPVRIRRKSTARSRSQVESRPCRPPGTDAQRTVLDKPWARRHRRTIVAMNRPDASVRQPTSLTGAGGRRVRPGSSRSTARRGSLSDDPLIISGTFDPKRAHLGSVIGREYEVRIGHLNDYRYRNSNPARNRTLPP